MRAEVEQRPAAGLCRVKHPRAMRVDVTLRSAREQAVVVVHRRAKLPGLTHLAQALDDAVVAAHQRDGGEEACLLRARGDRLEHVGVEAHRLLHVERLLAADKLRRKLAHLIMRRGCPDDVGLDLIEQLPVVGVPGAGEAELPGDSIHRLLLGVGDRDDLHLALEQCRQIELRCVPVAHADERYFHCSSPSVTSGAPVASRRSSVGSGTSNRSGSPLPASAISCMLARASSMSPSACSY